MSSFSSLIILDNDSQVIARQDFQGTEYLVTPIFAGYSQKYFKRDLFKETNFDYLEGLASVMNEDDLLVKRFFDEEVVQSSQLIDSLDKLMKSYRLPKETFLRLTGYLHYLQEWSDSFVVQQNSNDYPDVDKKIVDGYYQK